MNYVQLLLGVLALLAIASGVVGYFKANVSKATIELYKEDNAALRLRLETLEDQVASDAERIRVLEAARSTLLDVVTQAEAIAALQLAVANNQQIISRIATKLGVPV